MMNQKSCVHHWMIEPANGPTSKGVCLSCDLTRSFNNAMKDGAWPGWSKMVAVRAGRRNDA